MPGEFTFSISEDLAGGVDIVNITLTSGQAAGVALVANIDGNSLTFDQVTVPFVIDLGAGDTSVNLEVDGNGTLSEDGTTMDATLNIDVVSPDSGSTLTTDVCMITATKQQ